MLELLADENFKDQILEGLARRLDIDVVTAAVAGLRGLGDETVLGYSTQTRRILVSNDEKTLRAPAYMRIAEAPGSPPSSWCRG